MNPSDEYKSNEYLSLTYVLIQKLADLTKTKQLVMPLEMEITGAGEDTVLHVSVTERAGKVKFSNISGQDGTTLLPELSAQYPLTVTISDVRGTCLELKIEPDRTVH